MDPINIFKSQIPFIISTPEEPAEVAEPQPVEAPTSSLGIASATDVIEDASANNSSYLPFQSQQFIVPATSPNPLAQAETVDPSSLFDYFDLEKDMMVPKVDGESLKSGQVSWETIEFLKAELTNKNPDANAMIDKLLQLKPDDLAVTLMKLGETGKDVARIVINVCSNPEAMKKMGTLLTNVASNLPASKLQPLLTEMITHTAPRPGAQHVFMDFIEQTKEKDILPYLNEQSMSQIYPSLLDGTIEGSLCALALGKENSYRPPNPDGLIQGVPDPSTMLPTFINGDRQDLSVADALASFPEWGLNEINKMVADHGNGLSPLITRMMETNQDLGPFLAKFCTQPGSADALGSIFSQLKSAGLIQNSQSQYPVLRSTVADDQIRRMIEEMGNDALSVLSQLPAVQLLDIKAILQKGDDTAQNQLIIQNFIDPAYNAAKQG